MSLLLLLVFVENCPINTSVSTCMSNAQSWGSWNINAASIDYDDDDDGDDDGADDGDERDDDDDGDDDDDTCP